MLRELFVKIRLDSSDTEDRLKRMSSDLDRASQEFKKLGSTGDKSLKTMSDGFYELGRSAMGSEPSKELQAMAKAAGISEKAVDKLVQKTREDMKLDEQFRSAAKSAGLTEAEINKVKNSIDRAKESTASWKNVMSGLASVGITAFAGMFVSSGVKMAAETENLSVQFEVLMGDAIAAKKTLAELKDFSSSTNFESDQINKAGRQLLAVGVNADELIPKIRMIGDVANGSGKDFNELATIFAKNKSSNFIQGEDLNQLIEAGIPILDEFGKMFGKTALQVKEMGSKNQIEFKHLEEAFARMTGENGKYNNMTERLSKTSSGMWSTLSDKIKDVGKSIGTGILSLARPLLEFFTLGEQSGMRLNIALMTLALVVGVILVKATLAWAASLDVVTISAVKAYAALILPAVIVAAKLMALYLILEDIWVFFEYGPDASETYFADLLRWIGLTDDELQSLSDGFKELKNIFSEAWSSITEMLKNPIVKYVLIGLAVGIALLVAPMALLGAAIFALKVGLFLLLTVGIAALIAKWSVMTASLKKKWEEFKKDFMDLFSAKTLAKINESFKKSFIELLDWFTNLPFVDNLVKEFYSLKTRISGILSGMWESLKATFQSLLPTDTINTVIDGMNWISQKLNEWSSGRIAQTLGVTPLNLPMIAHIQARAMGGPINAGQPYLVGERGPELVVPKNNGTVIPNDKLSGSSTVSNFFDFKVFIQSTNEEYDAKTLFEKFMEFINSENSKEKQKYELGLS